MTSILGNDQYSRKWLVFQEMTSILWNDHYFIGKVGWNVDIYLDLTDFHLKWAKNFPNIGVLSELFSSNKSIIS